MRHSVADQEENQEEEKHGTDATEAGGELVAGEKPHQKHDSDQQDAGDYRGKHNGLAVEAFRASDHYLLARVKGADIGHGNVNDVIAAGSGAAYFGGGAGGAIAGILDGNRDRRCFSIDFQHLAVMLNIFDFRSRHNRKEARFNKVSNIRDICAKLMKNFRIKRANLKKDAKKTSASASAR